MKDLQNKNKAKAGAQEDLNNVTAGRKTVKTLFKSSKDTGNMVSKIENVSNKAIKFIFNFHFYF